jgi:hypothetical protein
MVLSAQGFWRESAQPLLPAFSRQKEVDRRTAELDSPV